MKSQYPASEAQAQKRKRRQGNVSCFPLLALLIAGILSAGNGKRVEGQEPPRDIPVSEIENQDGAVEKTEGSTPGVLLTPALSKPGRDEKYGETYLAQIMVYALERKTGKPERYVRRFRIYVPDADSLPFARKAARTLLTLFTLTREKLGCDHPRSTPVVNVWITRSTPAQLSSDIGGEQTRNDIYLYHLTEERKPIEWLRETAHEYGHFVLPGISGFTSPEEWGNGVLGERLFLLWIAFGLRENTLSAEAVPLAAPAEIERYRSEQITPLIRRIAAGGITEARIAKRDAGQMEAFVSLALYWRSVYGEAALRDAFAETHSAKTEGFAQAGDFLRGAFHSLKSASRITLLSPFSAGNPLKPTAFQVYLPAGAYRIQSHSGKSTIEIAETVQTGNLLKVNTSGWKKATLTGRLVLIRQ